MLHRRHPSIQRNPLIADVFHRTGLIEKWGRGTNRVAEMCRAAGIASPTYEEIGGAALVTFRVRVGSTAPIAVRSEPRARAEPSRRSESGQSQRPESVLADTRTPTEIRVLAALDKGPLNRQAIVQRLGHKSLSGALRKAISVLLQNEWIGYTIPEKPNSRLQQYRLSLAGGRALKERLGQRD